MTSRIVWRRTSCTSAKIAPVKMGSFNKLLNMVTGLKKRYDIGNQLKEIKQRALEVSDRRKRYKMDTSSAKSVVIDPRLPGLFQEAEKLVGVNIQRVEIVMLLDNDTNVCPQTVADLCTLEGTSPFSFLEPSSLFFSLLSSCFHEVLGRRGV